MDTFDEFEYERIDPQEFLQSIENYLDQMEDADSAQEQRDVLQKINRLRDHCQTMSVLAQIRHSIDTTDEKWEEEQDFYDEAGPVFQEAKIKLYRALIDSPFRDQLEREIGPQLFRIAELKTNTFDPAIKDQRREENKLSSRYQKLIASCRIEFKGKKRNLSGLQPFMEDPNRVTRREATEARWSFFSENEEELDKIFDDLVRVRDEMARELDYPNFIELAYDRLGRSDYGPKDVERLRDVVVEHVVPRAVELKKEQQKRLDVDEFKLYDEPCQFPDGNPEPQGSPEWIINQAQKMYHDSHSETATFIDYMMERELMDLKTQQGKAGGGYCTYLPDYEAPFIFSNFNGTAGDVRVLTHEGGHAFSKYLCRTFDIPEFRSPTPDAAEIHSMAMEFLTWPWMDLFFEEETDRFLYQHLSQAIRFLPYGCAVDEFQHRVYENPDLSPVERHEVWKEIETKYLPMRDTSDFDFTEKGGYWQGQRHIYRYPFYYIDYVLARICALQFWSREQRDDEKTWDDYIRTCELAGSRSFLELVDAGNLETPFEPDWVSTVLKEATDWLDRVTPRTEPGSC